MRKILILLILISILISLISCQVSEISGDISEKESINEPATVCGFSSSDVFQTKELTGMSLSTTESTVYNTILQEVTTSFEKTIVGKYTDEKITEFIRFATYSSRHRMSQDIPYMPNNTVKNIKDWFSDDDITPEKFFTFVIAGYTGKSDPTLIGPDYSYFYIYAKGINDSEFSDKVYTIRLNGTPDVPCYGVPRVKIGKEYFRYRTALETGDDLITYSNDGFLMCGSAFGEVVEKDGVKWLYPNKLFGFESFSSVVEITDNYENQIYKPGEDDDIIQYLTENNIPIPTYDYKIKLTDFILEMCN